MAIASDADVAVLYSNCETAGDIPRYLQGACSQIEICPDGCGMLVPPEMPSARIDAAHKDGMTSRIVERSISIQSRVGRQSARSFPGLTINKGSAVVPLTTYAIAQAPPADRAYRAKSRPRDEEREESSRNMPRLRSSRRDASRSAARSPIEAVISPPTRVATAPVPLAHQCKLPTNQLGQREPRLTMSKSSATVSFAAQAPARAPYMDGTYQLRAHPHGEEPEESSDSEDEDESPENVFRFTRSPTQHKLAAPSDSAPGRSSDGGTFPAELIVRPHLTAVTAAPILPSYPYNLPMSALPVTPHPTRRQILETERSQSLEQQLLWGVRCTTPA
ncbi:hypothetical protein OBBRIDRAFT_224021 [Obba rivulosa]|uniref:Uncharacterized protein n=1 Tax=Obba rivulosa TaxID=1052685 RepID=A0A8E2AKW4_9APHY|nr:hypothetical protein OBBRIDRAFT_224021 [Obba rivulosa]